MSTWADLRSDAEALLEQILVCGEVHAERDAHDETQREEDGNPMTIVGMKAHASQAQAWR